MMRPTRRSLLGFAAVLAAAPAAASAHGNHDGVLTAACAAFCQAQADFDVANAEHGWSDAEINRLSDRWHAALAAVLASPAPATPGGRVALARPARIALVIGTSDLGPGGWEAYATPEHQMVLMALSGLVGSAEA
jgi:hypothetical protein